jgi:hypothetical protein
MSQNGLSLRERKKIAKAELHEQLGELFIETQSLYPYVNEWMRSHEDPFVRELHSVYVEFFEESKKSQETLEKLVDAFMEKYSARNDQQLVFEDLYMSTFMGEYNKVLREVLHEQLRWFNQYLNDGHTFYTLGLVLEGAADSFLDCNEEVASELHKLSDTFAPPDPEEPEETS